MLLGCQAARDPSWVAAGIDKLTGIKFADDRVDPRNFLAEYVLEMGLCGKRLWLLQLGDSDGSALMAI